jgi:Trk-type K+ transport system membrane component
MNSINIARGKDRIDFRGREINGAAVRRAYSQIFLSLTAIGLSVLAVELCQDDLDLKAVIFECISAFSTVGLSLGITAKLCAASKLILIFTMFVGRISLLTVLVAFLKQGKAEKFRFPSEDILIN